MYGLTDAYPPFQLSSNGVEGQPTYPVQVDFTPPEHSSQFWAIPVLGFLIKGIILIPHLVVLGVLEMVVGILQLVLWIPVLFGGRYPEWGFNLVGGTLRWSACVLGYFYGITDEYPAFRLSGEPMR
jgi:hypothetical protein